MEKTLEKILSEHNRGLFLLDPPTGFGKTTAVINVIKRFLQGDPCFSKAKRIFFVTNLLANLPYNELLDGLTDEEKSQCFRARATVDYVLDNFLDTDIKNQEVIGSKEYKNLQADISSYHFTFSKYKAAVEKDKIGYRNSLKILKQKISTITEPAFRQFIKNKFLFNKSIQEKRDFIKENGWIRRLYPICDIEKYKVIFLSTKKFISPIDTFRRVPFYAYCDEALMDDAIVFFDEFDATKQELLNQIIDDGLKNHIDIVKLFLNIHYALQNLTLPKKILHTSGYHKAKVESGEWYTTEHHFSYWKEKFEEKYITYNINYLIKSVDFEFNKAFLFDDGKYITVIKDSSKKYICANVDNSEAILSLRGYGFRDDKPMINKIIRELEYCIDGFTQALFYVANNFMYSKNEGRSKSEIQYTLEEAIYTTLDVLNLGDDEKKYLFNKIQTQDYSFNRKDPQEGMHKGFNFTEIEDSNYHDMKSVVHNYNFSSTPEDNIIALSERAMIIGISATSKINTCIGNYDLTYLKKKMKENFVDISEEDSQRIEVSFNEMLKSTKGNYSINTHIFGTERMLSLKEQCQAMIDILFVGEEKSKFEKVMTEEKFSAYYYFIELKLAFLYNEMGANNIKSTIAFLNAFPTSNGNLNSDRLKEMFCAIDARFSRQSIEYRIVKAQNFDEDFAEIKTLLGNGKQVLLITTYQTIGSGKNIQYPIPTDQVDTMVYAPNDDRNMKDFEAIYLCAPTNLLQQLSWESEDKYNSLAKYLFQQEYLYKNRHLTYPQMKINIENGFRQIFFGERRISKYTDDGDFNAHTFKIIMQAVGRICRCRSKNKNIYIYADRALIENIQDASKKECPRLLNEEFRALLDVYIDRGSLDEKLAEYSRQTKSAYNKLSQEAYAVRRNITNVIEWQNKRDYVLKHPTANSVLPQYKDLYFEFSDKVNGYSYKQNNRYDIVDMRMDLCHGMDQVSEQSCDLPIVLSIPCVKSMFDENNYAKRFEWGKFCMSPSLFKQIYLGALGEVVGKCILESQLGWDVEELDDPTFYEYFDYKMGNVYFDFKHWNEFRVDNDEYVKKVQRKLSAIQGAKCFVINLIKRTDAIVRQNIGETVIQVPYLIDGEIGAINEEFIDEIACLI